MKLKNQHGFTVLEIILVVVLIGLIGAAAYVAVLHHKTTVTSAATPAALTISRSNPLKQPGIPDFTVKIESSTTADQLLADIQHLQHLPSGTINCPNDDGVNYTLVFLKPKVTAKIDASGCEGVQLSNSAAVYTMDTTDNSGATFKAALTKATGKPLGYPTP